MSVDDDKDWLVGTKAIIRGKYQDKTMWHRQDTKWMIGKTVEIVDVLSDSIEVGLLVRFVEQKYNDKLVRDHSDIDTGNGFSLGEKYMSFLVCQEEI